MRAVDNATYRAGIDYLCFNCDIMNDKLHELYGKIKDKKDRVESLQFKIDQLQKPESDCEAQLKLVINRLVRGTSYYYLDKNQVIMILQNEINGHVLELMELEEQYSALQ